jgi:aminoglycoside phosphotransferase (APT) family kinase protein
VKVYRDDTGRSAVAAAERAASALDPAGDRAAAVSAGGGVYVATDRAAWWPEVAGTSLADVVVLSGPAAAEAVAAAGRALRLLHDAPCPSGLPACPDVAQAAETVRTAQLLEALAPAQGARLRQGVGRVLDVLSALPAEPPTMTHGDFKCDNVVVDGPRLHLLDFDRCGSGDPAADLGKFLADLRWWADQGGHPVAPLHEAFLAAYGVTGPRSARSRAYDSLLQLRMAARRVLVQEADWGGRVERAVGVAVATLAEEL